MIQNGGRWHQRKIQMNFKMSVGLSEKNNLTHSTNTPEKKRLRLKQMRDRQKKLDQLKKETDGIKN